MRIARNTSALAAAAIAVGLATSACAGSSQSTAQTTTQAATTTTTTTAATTHSTATATATAAPAGTDLQSLMPTPADTQQTKGPDPIADNGIHMHYQVNGAPNDVMNAYKSALEGKGWQVTTIVTSAGGGGGGGATYTGTHGDAYGVFDGGGFNTNTYIDVCTWPSKPANPNCNRSDR
jgi:hypothetical protein